MSDASVAEALRSEVQRVVVEAPAGTGKTHQAASYARDATTALGRGQRVLILAHTHSACDVFSSRTTDLAGRLRIGTIDSLVATIAQIYHRALDLPADIHAWSIDRGQECYADLANRVRRLIVRSPGIASAVAERHPIVICDEHQDASSDQHTIVALLAQAGAKVRFFGDPMQTIFSTGREREAHELQWRELVASANAFERLGTAHRWANGSPELGAWVLEQREHLRAGGSVDLRNRLPRGLRLLRADNRAPRFGGFQLSPAERRPLDIVVRDSPNLLVLTAHNQTVFGLNAFWGARIPIWEGYTRNALGDLLAACRIRSGDPVALGRAMCTFLEAIGKGFSPTAFGNRLAQELETRCARPCRGKPAEIQSIARLILQTPDHTGVGEAIDRIHHLMNTSRHFSDARIDLRMEFAQARRIQAHPDISTVLAGLAYQRGKGNDRAPSRSISTIHKSKGLECDSAILIPCDAGSLAHNQKNRCLLYVALSRSCEQLTLVIPEANPSPLLHL
ncbi:UvrD-helicase domain-containing protein [Burkholderia cepacia]|uniref:UvrD-helicase domain-containing protein n=1 Tax=Burkholderia cepacia TaxID=292 RepID=UPI0007C71D7E|nr:UvrD-helicase domain-containing protein [Burkholderia cepacia]